MDPNVNGKALVDELIRRNEGQAYFEVGDFVIFDADSYVWGVPCVDMYGTIDKITTDDEYNTVTYSVKVICQIDNQEMTSNVNISANDRYFSKMQKVDQLLPNVIEKD